MSKLRCRWHWLGLLVSLLPPAQAVAGIWISLDEIVGLPMTGSAWERLLDAAEGDLGEPNLAGLNSKHDVRTLGVALVYGCTGDAGYREKTARAIESVMGTEYTGLRKGPGSEVGALGLSVARNLGGYVIAADLIGLADYDPALDAAFRTWIDGLRTVAWPDRSLLAKNEFRPNNHGTMAGAALAAVAVYLGDDADLARTARVFRGFLGDRTAHAGFEFRKDFSWHADPVAPLGINPLGAVRDGAWVDGAIPEAMRRGCPLQLPPCPTGYPWEALQGTVLQATILGRQGFDAWRWEDRAIARAVGFLHDLDRRFPEDGWWAKGDDRWVPWVVNAAYEADFPARESRIGKNMGWTDWTHGDPLASGADPHGPRCRVPVPEPGSTVRALTALLAAAAGAAGRASRNRGRSDGSISRRPRPVRRSD